MIDDDDVNFFALLGPLGNGPVAFVIWIAGLALIGYIACSNNEECGRRHCDHGHPALMKGECLCVEGSK